MIERALKADVPADYVLMDTWFTQQPLIKSIVETGLDVIGMVKATNQRYIVNGQKLSLKELYFVSTPIHDKKGILRSIHTKMANGIEVKVVFKSPNIFDCLVFLNCLYSLFYLYLRISKCLFGHM